MRKKASKVLYTPDGKVYPDGLKSPAVPIASLPKSDRRRIRKALVSQGCREVVLKQLGLQTVP